MFHFNKKHLEDPDVPMWVIKARGESYYVEHVTCELPWTTKETPDNSHTKGSIKVKNCYLVIDDDNHAHLKELTPEIEARLTKPEKIYRVITADGRALREACEGLEHGPIKIIGGACSTAFYITEFNSDDDYLMFTLKFSSKLDMRELKPNEEYYKIYSRFKEDNKEFIDEDWVDEDDDEEYDVLQERNFRDRITSWFV